MRQALLTRKRCCTSASPPHVSAAVDTNGRRGVSLGGGRVFRHGLIVARCASWHKGSGPEVLSPKSWCDELRAMIVVRLVRPKERAKKQFGDCPQQ